MVTDQIVRLDLANESSLTLGDAALILCVQVSVRKITTRIRLEYCTTA
jgi:hypothetical protein